MSAVGDEFNVGNRAIDLAEKGALDDLRELLSKNKDIVNSVKDWAGDGLLSIAVWHDRIDTVKLLIEVYDAHVNDRNCYGSTPLHRACASNNFDCVRYLVDKGALLNIRDRVGKRPVDAADGFVRDYLKTVMDSHRRIIEDQMRAFEVADKEFDEHIDELREAERKVAIAKRLYDAVPIVIEDALNPSLNGIYDPMDDTSDDWPCYRKRDGEEDIWMVFSYTIKSWLVRRATSSWATGRGETVFEGGFLAKLFTDPPAFPELRLQGQNGIEEKITSSHQLHNTEGGSQLNNADGRKGLYTSLSYDNDNETTVTVTSGLNVFTEEELKARVLLEALRNEQRASR